ncbi:MAG: mevalonate kinase, partial [Anaerolineae bacterium]|nr:mevalonate kinase [Anaerolineae bacterium]
MSFEFSAPAKIILFGEHAVVYGQPAIAVPVSSVRVYAAAYLSDCSGLRILARDLNQEILVTSSDEHSDQSPLAWVVGRTLREFGISTLSGEIDIRSEIPLASGLGSGAAISAVLVRSVAALSGVLVRDQVVNSLVFEAEKIYHGNPSGVDNTVIVFERGLFFRRELPFVTMTMRNRYDFLIADTGVRASTKIAVDGVRRLYEQETGRTTPILEEIGRITTEARMLLEDGEDHQQHGQ